MFLPALYPSIQVLFYIHYINRNTNGKLTDRISKNVIKLFKEIGFKIEIETNLKIFNFLDVTFNLTNSKYKPYRKPNDNLMYIHISSNHPRQIIKHLPDSVEERLSNNSSKKQVFNSAKPEYGKDLKDSGYKNVNLKYRARKEHRKKNNQKRKVICFNPPYSKQVSTDIAKRFANLLDQHFPKQHRLYKIDYTLIEIMLILVIHAQKICLALFHLTIKNH